MRTREPERQQPISVRRKMKWNWPTMQRDEDECRWYEHSQRNQITTRIRMHVLYLLLWSNRFGSDRRRSSWLVYHKDVLHTRCTHQCHCRSFRCVLEKLTISRQHRHRYCGVLSALSFKRIRKDHVSFIKTPN